MFVIQIEDVAKVLDAYSCDSNVVAIDMLAHYQQDCTTCIVICATTYDRNRYVLKLLDDPLLSQHTEEKQASYSEFLRTCGLLVPKKYKCKGQYCTRLHIQSYWFFITVEDYFGEDLKEISLASAHALGACIGRIHTLSLSAQYHLGQGCVFSALDSGRTSFQRIWRGVSAPVMYNEGDYQRLCKTHNEKMDVIRNLWHSLPTAAVHGDLGLINNIVYNKDGYGIIDFNLAGDEMLLGDFLITWYSSRYSLSFIRRVPQNQIELLWNSYFDGYKSYRQITKREYDTFDNLSRILNGVYFGKFVVDLIQNDHVELGNRLFPEIERHYGLKDTPLPLNLYGGAWQ